MWQQPTGIGGAVPVVITPPAIPYGAPFASSSLSNISLDGGAASNYSGSLRFQSPVSSNLTALDLFFFSEIPGYGGGDFGDCQIIICPDDGTANHEPVVGTVLFTTTLSGAASIGGSGQGGTPRTHITVSPPVLLTAGSIYHVYCQNVDAAPGTNWFSLDMMFSQDGQDNPAFEPPFMGGYDNWGLLYKPSNVSAWDVAEGYMPTMALYYSNGAIFGSGYMEVAATNRTVSGVNQLREIITVSGSSRIVNGVRVAFASGTGTPSVRLETGGGTLIESGTLTADPVYNNAAWHYYRYNFSVPRTLTLGQSYNLIFSAPSGTLSVTPIRKGSAEYSYPPEVCFGDGSSQFSTNSGSTWTDTGLAQYGQSAEQDIPFMFY